MKLIKKLTASILFVCLLFSSAFLFSACENKNAYRKGLLSKMKDTAVNMTGVKAFGVAKATGGTSGQNTAHAASSPGKNRLVKQDEQGNIEEVVYKKENKNQTITQSSLGTIARFWVTQDFTFIMYTNDNISFAESNAFWSNQHCQTFIIHNNSGKIYAAQDFKADNIGTTFEVIGGILGYPSSNSQQYIFYQLKVDANQDLQFVSIIDNPDVIVNDINQDKFGNAIVYGNIEGKSEKALFIKNSTIYQYYISTENVLHRVKISAAAVHTVEFLNANREWEAVENTANTILYAGMHLNSWYWSTGNDAYVLKDGNLFLFNHSGAVVYFAEKIGDFWSKPIDSYYAAGSTEKLFFVDDVLFVFFNKNNGAEKALYYIDLAGFTATEGDYGQVDVQLPMQNILECVNAYMLNGEMVAEVVEPSATKQYKITFDGSQAHKELVSEVVYQGQPVIAIKPIN